MFRALRQRWQSWPGWFKAAIATTLAISLLYVGVYVVSITTVLVYTWYTSLL